MGYRVGKVDNYDAIWHVMCIRTGSSLIWEWRGRHDNHNVNTNRCVTSPIWILFLLFFSHLINISEATTFKMSGTV